MEKPFSPEQHNNSDFLYRKDILISEIYKISEDNKMDISAFRIEPSDFESYGEKDDERAIYAFMLEIIRQASENKSEIKVKSSTGQIMDGTTLHNLVDNLDYEDENAIIDLANGQLTFMVNIQDSNLRVSGYDSYCFVFSSEDTQLIKSIWGGLRLHSISDRPLELPQGYSPISKEDRDAAFEASE
jgi:hypothetical protein